ATTTWAGRSSQNVPTASKRRRCKRERRVACPNEPADCGVRCYFGQASLQPSAATACGPWNGCRTAIHWQQTRDRCTFPSVNTSCPTTCAIVAALGAVADAQPSSAPFTAPAACQRLFVASDSERIAILLQSFNPTTYDRIERYCAEIAKCAETWPIV